MRSFSLLLACLFLPTGLGAQDTPPADPLTARASGIAQSLGELAVWCGKNKLLRERDELCATVIAFDPEHAFARKTLKYRKTRQGWRQRSTFRPSKRTNEKKLDEYALRRSEICAPIVKATVEHLDRRDVSRLMSNAARRRIFERLILLAPEDESLRKELGQVRYEGRWVPAEIGNTPKNARRILDRAEALPGELAPPELMGASGEEKQLGLGIKEQVTTYRLRVSGPVAGAELQSTARVIQVSRKLYGEIFGRTPPLPITALTLLFPESSIGNQWLKKDHRVQPDQREPSFDVVGGRTIGGRIYAVAAEDSTLRAELAIRQVLGATLGRGFGISGEQAALYEGVCIYITYRALGSRRVYTIGGEAKGDYGRSGNLKKVEKALREEGANWFELADDFVFKKGGPLNLVALHKKSFNEMDAADLLLAYVFSAWLIEADPPGRRSFLRLMGADKGPAVAIREGLEARPDEVEDRLRKWLRFRSTLRIGDGPRG